MCLLLNFDGLNMPKIIASFEITSIIVSSRVGNPLDSEVKILCYAKLIS